MQAWSGLSQQYATPDTNFCLCLGFIALKRHRDHRNSYKEKYLFGASLQFQRFSMQADTVLEEALRILYLDLQKALGVCMPLCTLLDHMRSQRLSQKWHTFSNKVTPSNSATLYGSSIKTESMGSIPIQTTILTFPVPQTIVHDLSLSTSLISFLLATPCKGLGCGWSTVSQRPLQGKDHPSLSLPHSFSL